MLQVEADIEQNTPEELTPLIEALQRARQQQEEATGIREALEAEVCFIVLAQIHGPKFVAFWGL